MSPDRLPRAAAADTHDTLVQQALAASQADDAATDDGALYRLVREHEAWRVEGRYG